MWPQIDPDLSMRNPTDIGCKDIGEVLKKGEGKINRVIFIIPSSFSSPARYKLKAFAKDGLTIELFEEVEVRVCQRTMHITYLCFSFNLFLSMFVRTSKTLPA